MKYFVIPDSRDGCTIATHPEPVALERVGQHIADYLKRFEHQGYFSNCKRERIPLGELAFYVVPQNKEGGYFR